MKRCKSLLSVLLVIAVVLSVAGLSLMTPPALAADETLTISGDGVDKEITFKRADLEALGDIIEEYTYSTTNSFPTNKVEYDAGVPLAYLLEQAGLKDAAQKITFVASDGYKRTFTISEILTESRYNFPETGEKELVPTLVCLQSSADGLDSLEDIDLKLVMGQRAPGEQTSSLFVKYLAAIEVSCEAPEQWAEVTFVQTPVDNGISVVFEHEKIDNVKIYYTTDGSTPTIESTLYNVSTTNYQPELNLPLVVTKTTVVKAIAIGSGKTNSEVTSITVTIDGTSSFTDLAGYDWAVDAIEELTAMGVVNGVGGDRFAPESSLTRGMFVTMLGRALNKDDSDAPSDDEAFSDVDYSSWYGPHVRWAVANGIVTGYPDGTFKPEKNLTVEEMIAMAVRAGGLEANDANAVALTGVGEWAESYAQAAEQSGMLLRGILSEETEDGIVVEGQRQASRAEAAVIVYGLLQALETAEDA